MMAGDLYADDDGITYTETLTGELIGAAADATGIAHPGDVLVLSYDPSTAVSSDAVASLRAGLLKRLPGLADVVVIPFTLAAIYRPDPDQVI